MDVPLQQTLRCGGTLPHQGSLRTGSHHLSISERRLRPLLRRISMLVLPLLCFSSLPSFLCSPEGEMACRPSLALRRRGFRDFRCRGDRPGSGASCRVDRVAPRAAEDKETMGDLFTKYFRLQDLAGLRANTHICVGTPPPGRAKPWSAEVNQQLEADTKVSPFLPLFMFLLRHEGPDAVLYLPAAVKVVAELLEVLDDLELLGFD
ncbi:unnamed protein product [Polarella glacialis]|uniref:Uncharacterized protein n=1 Tax=Polarella glacialis TaxID=89957 RepID=A0A813HQW4_POLGL|nr:unnamed protein product [Polarella glacialis]